MLSVVFFTPCAVWWMFTCISHTQLMCAEKTSGVPSIKAIRLNMHVFSMCMQKWVDSAFLRVCHAESTAYMSSRLKWWNKACDLVGGETKVEFGGKIGIGYVKEKLRKKRSQCTTIWEAFQSDLIKPNNKMQPCFKLKANHFSSCIRFDFSCARCCVTGKMLNHLALFQMLLLLQC